MKLTLGNKVLVVGPSTYLNYNPAALYNINDNSWRRLDDTRFDRTGSATFNLNGRIFTMGGYDDLYRGGQFTFVVSETKTTVEEFYHQNNTWAVHDAKTLASRFYSKAVPLPVELFPNLQGKCHGIA